MTIIYTRVGTHGQSLEYFNQWKDCGSGHYIVSFITVAASAWEPGGVGWLVITKAAVTKRYVSRN